MGTATAEDRNRRDQADWGGRPNAESRVAEMILMEVLRATTSTTDGIERLLSS